MAAQNSRMIFVNLPVRNLEKSVEFFTRLGFTFNPRFTDENATCMIVSEQASVMLLVTPFFQTFTKNAVCDTSSHTEALLALSCSSRAEVDEMVATAIAAGGKHVMPATDHGFMYGWSFYDLDNHHWEVLWMDPQMAQG